MAEPHTETSEDLIQFLEQVSGRKLRTRENIRRYLDEISTRKPDDNFAVRFWKTAKDGMWLLLLAAAFLQYYFLDILIQVESIPEIRANVPVPVQQHKPSSRT